MRLCSALVLGVTAATLVPAPSAVAGGLLPQREMCAVSSWQGAECAESHLPQEAAAPRRIGTAPRIGTARRIGTAPRADQQQPSCGDPRSVDFPLGTRIHGGPGTYQPGGDSAEWYLDLTNDTGAACHDIHPVLILVDHSRNLWPDHVRAEFYDTASDTWHPVPFIRTDEDELIGVFGTGGGDGTPGFTVGAGRTASVQVRLAFTEAARPNTVVANTAVVQRKGKDGEWVGQSADYRFAVDPNILTGDSSYSEAAGSLPELAQSGPSLLFGLGGSSVALVLGGGALVAGSRRTLMRTAVRTRRLMRTPYRSADER
ncbi:hypothetical protein [Streptomyces sp. NPDC048442]|uniref:hypothetical protein n=1 Tax=Streptomyces sp. NPDC048442 TaxID=3154823 RepID=UPI003442B3AF